MIACCDPSSAARTTAGDRASASASRRRSRRYIPTRDATCVAMSWPRSFACRSTTRVTLRLENSANPATRTRATTAPMRRKLCRSCWVRLDMSRVGSEATQGYPAGQVCLFSCTYDSGAQLRPGGRRSAVAGAMGARALRRARPGPATPAVLQPHDVPLSLRGGTARGEHVRIHRRRYLRPVQAAPRIRRARADRVRRVRHSLRELRALGRHASREAHPAEYRDLPPAAEALRGHVRLASRALDHRPPLLQVDAVDLPAALQGGDRLPEEGGGQLVSEGYERRGERAGDQRFLRAPSRHEGRAAVPRAVVLQDHPVCGTAAREPRPARLVRLDAHAAAQLDRPERRGGADFRNAGRRPEHPGPPPPPPPGQRTPHARTACAPVPTRRLARPESAAGSSAGRRQR